MRNLFSNTESVYKEVIGFMEYKTKQPKVALIESIRSIGYNFNSALADIVDNSISADAKNVQINLVPSIPAIVIIDDGYGMDTTELDNAMDLGSKNPNDERTAQDLGRFGLGLKSASFSQCRKLTVTSLKNNEINSMTWDLKEVERQKDWIIGINSEEQIEKLPYIDTLKKSHHGTIVQWEDFDRIKNSNGDLSSTLNNLLLKAYEYLALVFHKYVEAGKITIEINGNVLEKRDPFLSYRNDTQKFKSEYISIPNSKNQQCIVEVKPYILPFAKNITPEDFKMMGGKENMRNQQGFYIYRNNRLIEWGTWLHMIVGSELYKNARIEVNIPNTLDDIWEVDIKKASATIPGIIRQPLIAHVKKAIGGSQKVYKKRGQNQSKELGYASIWNVSEERDTYDVSINKDNPLITQLKSQFNDEQNAMFDALIRDIEANLPKMGIYTNVAESKEESKKQTNNEIEENVRNILSTMIENSASEKVSFLDSLFQSEPYCLNMELHDRLVEELNNDK